MGFPKTLFFTTKIFFAKAYLFLSFFFFFFFFKFKILLFRQNKSYDQKIQRQCTLGSYLKICRRNCHKNQHLLFFDDFGKIFDFLPNLDVFEGHLWNFEIVGNRQTQKKFFLETDKFMEIMFNILKYASECQIDAIFAIKSDWLLGTKSQSILSNDYRFL